MLLQERAAAKAPPPVGNAPVRQLRVAELTRSLRTTSKETQVCCIHEQPSAICWKRSVHLDDQAATGPPLPTPYNTYACTSLTKSLCGSAGC